MPKIKYTKITNITISPKNYYFPDYSVSVNPCIKSIIAETRLYPKRFIFTFFTDINKLPDTKLLLPFDHVVTPCYLGNFKNVNIFSAISQIVKMSLNQNASS